MRGIRSNEGSPPLNSSCVDMRVLSTVISSSGGRGTQRFGMVYELPQTTHPMTETESASDDFECHQAHYSHSQDGFTPLEWSQEEKDASQ